MINVNSYATQLLRTQVLFFLCLFCVSLFLSSCSRDEIKLGPIPDVFFQYEEIYGSGSQVHNGWFIDTNGNIIPYDLPTGWIFPDDQHLISRTDVNSNLSKTGAARGNVKKNRLSEFAHLIHEVDPANLSELQCTFADVNSHYLYCYIWRQPREGEGFYEVIELAEGGSCLQSNLDPEAVEITEWLIGIGRGLDPEFGF